MSADSVIFSIFNLNLQLIFKIGFIAFAILYFIFSLVVVRQVFLLTETIITEAAGVLRALAILFAGLSLGIIILFIMLL